jgi:hypothetical protein
MNKIAIASVLLMVAISYAGLVSAHQSDTDEVEFEGHYKEMLDLHKQYYNDEITFDEFYEKMESEEFDEDDMPCHSGFGMMSMMWR